MLAIWIVGLVVCVGGALLAFLAVGWRIAAKVIKMIGNGQELYAAWRVMLDLREKKRREGSVEEETTP